DPCAQLRQRHAALDEQFVQSAVDAGGLVVRIRGTHTNPSVSRCRRWPCLMMADKAKHPIRTANGHNGIVKKNGTCSSEAHDKDCAMRVMLICFSSSPSTAVAATTTPVIKNVRATSGWNGFPSSAR